MSTHPFRFPKSRRLHLRKEINELFIRGKSIHATPLKAIYIMQPGSENGLKMAVAVPKRYFKLAVDRNRVKRQIREAFRLNSREVNSYFDSNGITVHLLIIYNSKVLPDYAVLTSKIILILQRLKQVHEVDAV